MPSHYLSKYWLINWILRNIIRQPNIFPSHPLRWRQNGHYSVSNHQPRECLVYSLIRCRSKKTLKLRVTGLCAGNSPDTGEFPAQRASNAENVSIWWRHHEMSHNMQCYKATHYMMTSWNWITFAPFWWETGKQTTINMELCFLCLPEQAVEEIVKLSVIWYSMALIWRHYNVTITRDKRDTYIWGACPKCYLVPKWAALMTLHDHHFAL